MRRMTDAPEQTTSTQTEPETKPEATSTQTEPETKPEATPPQDEPKSPAEPKAAGQTQQPSSRPSREPGRKNKQRKARQAAAKKEMERREKRFKDVNADRRAKGLKPYPDIKTAQNAMGNRFEESLIKKMQSIVSEGKKIKVSESYDADKLLIIMKELLSYEE